MELRDQIAVRGVDLDAIEARFLRAQRGGDVRRDRLRDARLGHLLRHDGLERRLVDRMRNGRRRNGRLAANVDAGVAAAVTELNRGLGAAAMNFADQARQPRNKPIVIDADFVAAVAAAFSGDAISTVMRPVPPRTRAM
jgi:hypothetical protein